MPSPSTKPTTETMQTDAIHELLRRAEQGDRGVLPQLRTWLDSNPDYWRQAGDLAGIAEQAWVAFVAAGNLANQEAIQRKLDALKAELAGPFPSPMERLLAERVAISWLQANFADLAYLGLRAKGCTDLRFFKAAELRQESAQRRLTVAIKALATVQRLLQGKSRTGLADTRARDADEAANRWEERLAALNYPR